jgi:L-methionine (R)-S-oxide reductase
LRINWVCKMSEDIIIDKSLSKEEKYKSLLPQIESLVEGEEDVIANIANIIAALKYSMDGFFWVGVYFRKGEVLTLGPFQGPVACTRMTIPNGVCGECAAKKETIIVPDVKVHPGHIACSSLSKSEIVTPVFSGSEVIAVLDVDSDRLAHFDETDRQYLEKVSKIISKVME